MDKRNRYRLQTIAATGQTVSARWNVNSKSVDESIRFDADGVVPIIRLGRRCVRIPTAEGDAALLRFMQDGGAK